jgi:3-keto-disaccharide hydrolase
MARRIDIRAVAAVIAAAIAIAGSAFAGAAFGDVLVYVNDLASGKDGKELSHFEGKAADCARHVRGGSLLIQVTGKDTCGYRLPLEADKPQPNHAIHARLKLDKQTLSEIRKKAFLGVAVRYGGGTGYSLRILPDRHQFKLRRLPNGTGFPVAGKTRSIKATGNWNEIRLQALGTHVVAVINGKKVANVNDSAAADVKGRKAEVFAGANKANKVGAFARVDDVRLAVPSP